MASKLGLLLFVLLLSPAAFAAAVDNLYTGEAPVPDQSSQARAEAFKQALSKVLVRVSGDADAARTQAGRAILDDAKSLVQRYGYEKTAKDELHLRARFDARRVDGALRQAGLPVWGRERPKTLAWIAIDTGASASLLSAGGSEDKASALQRTADARGVPMALPRLDAAERRRVSVSDVLRRDDDRLRSVSRAYGANHLLIAHVSRSGDWQGRWTLLSGTDSLASWQSRSADLDSLLAGAVRHVADIYAHRYAVYAGGNGALVAVGVEAVENAGDYARISRYLADLTAVQSVTPVLLRDNAVVFRVELNGGADVLERSIQLADWLAPDDAARDLAGFYASGDKAAGYRIQPR